MSKNDTDGSLLVNFRAHLLSVMSKKAALDARKGGFSTVRSALRRLFAAAALIFRRQDALFTT
jgi:hypothetical protein